MTFNSVEFLIFFPVVVMLYFLLPQKVRWIWLLLSSYFFYMCWNPRYVLLIAGSTLITWLGGILVDVFERSSLKHKVLWKKWCVAVCCLSNLGILGFFKYYNFFSENINALFAGIGVTFRAPAVDVLLPVGISFYIFQALGYLIDVYRKTISPEKNVFRYALFVSFFPQLVAGPIERSSNLIGQLRVPHFFDGERVTKGLLMMGWGFFKKVVIADRAAILVTAVYDHYMDYSGAQIVFATMLFAVQIYGDFSGYSDIAVGAAQVLGIDLMENFDRPYFATSVAGFWRKWHISLTSWFRDYLYIPLGGNRKGRLVKYRNILITFGLSGLWHGASWNYLLWGCLNGFYQVVGDLTSGIRRKIKSVFHIRKTFWPVCLVQGILTFILVDFSWLFFRADNLETAFSMITHGINHFDFASMLDSATVLGLNTLALDEPDFHVLLIAILLLLIIDALKGKIQFRTWILHRNVLFRALVYYVIIFGILIFGIYGPEFDASTFIYFQF